MSFRRRLTLLSAAAVAIAVVLGSILSYLEVSHQLHKDVDSSLRERANQAFPLLRGLGDSGRGRVLIGGAPIDRRLGALGRNPRLGVRERDRRPPGAAPSRIPAAVLGPPSPFGPSAKARGVLLRPATGAALAGRAGAAARSANPTFPQLPVPPNQVRGYQQLVESSGRTFSRPDPGFTLPVDPRALALARHGGRPFISDARVRGVHLRVLTVSAAPGLALQFARPLTDTDRVLGRVRWILVVIAAAGVALAALLGRAVSGAAVSPVKRLTRATEHVRQTQDLSERIETSGGDELGRLALGFNAMLDALEQSMQALDASAKAQRRLVADASHELRTPITSLRTNIEFLQQAHDVAPADREQLLADLVEQIEELTLLMNDLIELARGDEPQAPTEEVRFDQIVADAVARAGRHAPDMPVRAELEETIVEGVPSRLDRAVNNLIDNAVTWSPAGGPVEVTLRDRELLVRDHGPGIAPVDLPHIFDRFYRGAEARGRPGSGLGLAIVRQVAESHGASVSAELAPGGGTIIRLRLAPEAPGSSRAVRETAPRS